MRWLQPPRPLRAGLSRRTSITFLGCGLGAALLLTPAATAEGPARASEAFRRAEDSFVRFAERWLAGALRATPEDNGGRRTAPDPHFTVELRPTGRDRVPFVGLLHYNERVTDCGKLRPESCRVGTTIPITEIFRYQNGNWIP